MFGVIIVLALFAGFRGQIDNDYNSYLAMFEMIKKPSEYFTDYSTFSYLEPFYYLIPAVYKLLPFDSYVLLFVFFAFLGVGFKLLSIWKLSDNIGLAVITYFSFFFLLHEMTQIRIGIASGIMLISISMIKERKIFLFVMTILFATCFHYTSLLFLPIYFLDSEKINKKLWTGILTVPFILYVLKIDFIQLISILSFGIFAEKLTVYQSMFELGQFSDKVNILNVRILLQIFLTSLFLYYADFLQSKNKYAVLLLKLSVLSLTFFILFASLPVFAFRFQELFGVVQIVLYPFIFYIVKEKYIGIFVVIFLALLTLLFNLYYLQLLKPYF
ncbi:hypothetical protein FLGSB24_03220 [Flavobacterium sp. GSB-24]|nr:hypothetical protein FLGSB24_03220 [Flavobacterium sp. GSB-24]